MLTHHHPDHVGGLAEVVRRTPQAQVHCGTADAAAIGASTGVSVEGVGGDEHILGLEVIPTPGHTPGHVCLFDPVSSTMLQGDVVGNLGRLSAAWPSGSSPTRE